jgi:thiaminase (transcriptional activator TenA)
VGFSDELWGGITDIYDAILAHPFLTGLADGSLPGEAFDFYLAQDALYLKEYARALALVAARAPSAAETEMFARHAAEAIAVEQELHRSLLGEPGVAAGLAAEPAPANLAYTSYLLSLCALGSYPEAVGAVLPCYWIYLEVGKALVRRGSPDPRYQRWIATYGGDEFAATVREVLTVTDRLGAALSAQERQRVRACFRATSRYEWMFWDMGYRMETWPAFTGVSLTGEAELPASRQFRSGRAE